MIISLRVDKGSDAAHYYVSLPETYGMMETRLRFAQNEDVRSAKAPHFHERFCSEDALRLQTLPLSAERLGGYVALSGDANPIHVDPAAARLAGFEDVIAPGMMLCILAEMACCTVLQLGRLREVRARFLSPAVAGHPVTFIFEPTLDGVHAKTRVFVIGPREELHAVVDLFAAQA
ncbi:MaoC family dehydratase [Shimia marina]|nr:MaoC family dehydratase [Shimia marina]